MTKNGPRLPRLQVDETVYKFSLPREWQERYGLLEHAEIIMAEPGRVSVFLTVGATGEKGGTGFGYMAPDVAVYEAAIRDPAGFLEGYICEHAEGVVADSIQAWPDAKPPQATPEPRLRKVNRAGIR